MKHTSACRLTQLTAINSRLLAFMAHDRVTLAGSMVAIGLLYVVLSVFGIRRGLHWARQAVLVSAFTGFVSFFLFLGFGYLDTFHAFVTAALLQLLLLGVHARLGVYTPATRPDLRGDRAWRLSLWGQLLLVFHGFALLAAGAVISLIGVTQVFVHEDLMFMETTAATLAAANPRLVPLVAHDRATLGGMLLAGGWVFLLPALWGYRRGSPWLWWALLIAGSIAYAAGIVVHYAVGYLSFKHLLPAFGGYALLLVGLTAVVSVSLSKEFRIGVSCVMLCTAQTAEQRLQLIRTSAALAVWGWRRSRFHCPSKCRREWTKACRRGRIGSRRWALRR